MLYAPVLACDGEKGEKRAATESMRDYLPGEYRVIADVIEEDQNERLP